MKDKELEEILDKVAVEAVAIMLAGKAELYIPTVKKYEQKLLAWRDNAVREARIKLIDQVNELLRQTYPNNRYEIEQEIETEKLMILVKELQDGK